MNQKAKLSLAIVILVIAAGWAGYQLTRPGPISNRLMLVCAATGETFLRDRGDVPVIPMKNPETGERTVLPCHKNDDGELYVNSRYRAALVKLGEKNRYVDTETLRVQSSP